MTAPRDSPDGLVVIDKPAGWTSHDVVAKLRGVLHEKKIGHAGTLDPMATGVLVVGVLRATRLLGFLSDMDKEYVATLRLGVTTTTDDAEGEVVGQQDASSVTDEDVRAAMQPLTGTIEQVPSAVSAVKVDGVRAYQRVRRGETVDIPARQVTVSTFEVLERRGAEVDVRVVCSSGTYVRALARDVGAALGVGAHLTALRRTRIGVFTINDACTVEQVESGDYTGITLSAAVAEMFPRLDVDAETAQRLAFGQKVPLPGVDRPTGAFGPDGSVVALVEPREDGLVKPLVGFMAR
jgi:tRNA pseudouridine55 synthase